MDLTIDCGPLSLPEGDERTLLTSHESVPRPLRAFFHDYDPHGLVSFKFRLARPPGPQGTFTLAGDLTPLGASAAYRLFPYRLSELGGMVHFGPDGIRFDEFAGRHGAARVRLSGRINATTLWTGLDLTIDGDDVALDDDLYRPLAENLRQLWRHFNPSGKAHTTVHLLRPQGSPDTGPGPWRTSVLVDLQDATACIDGFPYPIDHVRGRVRIDPARLEFNNIRGRHGTARVRAEGWATHDDPAHPEIEIQLDARHVPLDDVFRRAVPPAARAALADVKSAGRDRHRRPRLPARRGRRAAI